MPFTEGAMRVPAATEGLEQPPLPGNLSTARLGEGNFPIARPTSGREGSPTTVGTFNLPS